MLLKLGFWLLMPVELSMRAKERLIIARCVAMILLLNALIIGTIVFTSKAPYVWMDVAMGTAGFALIAIDVSDWAATQIEHLRAREVSPGARTALMLQHKRNGHGAGPQTPPVHRRKDHRIGINGGRGNTKPRRR